MLSLVWALFFIFIFPRYCVPGARNFDVIGYGACLVGTEKKALRLSQHPRHDSDEPEESSASILSSKHTVEMAVMVYRSWRRDIGFPHNLQPREEIWSELRLGSI